MRGQPARRWQGGCRNRFRRCGSNTDQPRSPLNAPRGLQMSRGALKCPIQQFLRRLIPPFESCRTEFVRTLGYRNIEVGRLHLDSWLDRGEGYEGLLKHVAAVFPDYAGELQKAIADTADIKVAEGDATWRSGARRRKPRSFLTSTFRARRVFREA